MWRVWVWVGVLGIVAMPTNELIVAQWHENGRELVVSACKGCEIDAQPQQQTPTLLPSTCASRCQQFVFFLLLLLFSYPFGSQRWPHCARRCVCGCLLAQALMMTHRQIDERVRQMWGVHGQAVMVRQHPPTAPVTRMRLQAPQMVYHQNRRCFRSGLCRWSSCHRRFQRLTRRQICHEASGMCLPRYITPPRALSITTTAATPTATTTASLTLHCHHHHHRHN
jgi:hypothetical protein